MSNDDSNPERGVSQTELIRLVYRGDALETPGTQTEFAGDLINFGHWHGLAAPYGRETRVRASLQLYDTVADYVGLCARDRVLEVGSGRGVGLLHLTGSRFPRSSIGIDVTPEQVRRAQSKCEPSSKVSFYQASADNIPLPPNSVDVVLSVEALQHFDSTTVTNFFREAKRVLASDGRLGVSTFLAVDAEQAHVLNSSVRTYRKGLDISHAIGWVVQEAECVGFVSLLGKAIGKEVFPCLSRWLHGRSHPSNPRLSADLGELVRVYELGCIDYFILVFQKRR